jgi:hypothetical protein
MVVRGVHLNVLLVVSVVARVRHPVLKVNLLLFQIQRLAVVVEVLPTPNNFGGGRMAPGPKNLDVPPVRLLIFPLDIL